MCWEVLHRSTWPFTWIGNGLWMDETEASQSKTSYVLDDWNLRTNSKSQRNLALNRLIPTRGMLFVWIPHPFVYEVVKAAETMGFRYVENLVWIKRDGNGEMREESTVEKRFLRSHETLYFFRVPELGGKRMMTLQIRHQRNSDLLEASSPPDPGLFSDVIGLCTGNCGVIRRSAKSVETGLASFCNHWRFALEQSE